MATKCKIFANVFRLLVLFLVIVITSCSGSLDKMIEKKVITDNKKCPVAIDIQTRLDSVIHPQSGTIAYCYTLISLDKDFVLQEINPEELHNNLIKVVKTAADFSDLKKLDAVFRYTYYDKKGISCFSFDITPDQYK